MSTSAALPLALANGTSVVPAAEDRREAEFLTKLLHIRDEVFAGKHPRIRLPPKVLEQVAPRPPQTTPVARPTTNGTLNGISNQLPLPPRPESFVPKSEPAASAWPSLTKAASSGIDPVLLTKSDHLIRAELQLKRQQLERGLKEQLDKRGRANDEEREVLDVDDLLAQAHRLVPPISGLRPPPAADSDGEESFDNSYYSSKADSWSSDEADRNNHSNADVAGSLTQQGKRVANQTHRVAKPSQAGPSNAPVIDLDDEPYEPGDDILEIYESEAAGAHDDLEESDYSPPPADAGPSEPRRPNGRHNNGGANGYGSDASLSIPNSMTPDFHPAALSRLEIDDSRSPTIGGSPTSGCSSNRGLHSFSKNPITNHHPRSRRQSPNGPVPPIQNGRKRKRDWKKNNANTANNNSTPKRIAQSPEPYIKEEPQSPPSFAQISDPPSSKRRALQTLPNDMEVVERVQPIYYRDQEPARPARHYDEPLSPGIARLPQRRPERDDQDLRRVASMQYARRPYSPTGNDLYAAPAPRQARAASHVFAERPIEQQIYREASARASMAPRYASDHVQVDYIEQVQSPLASPMAMAPPPRRIVVDQYGNKYYAAPVEARESVAPPSRRVEVDPYYERAVTREPTLRAPARPELYEEETIQRMPPPPRRYVEASEAEMVESRAYRREASHRPSVVDRGAYEMVERRPIAQYEEMGPPRQYLPGRAYSVRPEVVRREAPEGYARHESVQPGHARIPVAAPRLREISVVHPDGSDDRQYAFATPQRRYIEDAGLERPMEVVQERFATEAPRRTSYRY